jgi:catechol 2,3-dioxygenase-like lactoylglutathione lyase family enzyme
MATKQRLAILVPIRNMTRALRFFTKSLGAKKGERGRGEMRNWWASVRLLGTDLWLVRPSAYEKRKLAYTTILVPDIKRYVAKLRRNGVKFEKPERMGPETRIEGPIAFESFGGSAFFKDSEGNLWMVWQDFPPM